MVTKQAKKRELPTVDHSKIEYEPFKSNLYIETPQIASMTDAEVETYRAELEGIKIRGQNCPKPIKTWMQCGLSKKM